jgi:hypothetical protein
MAGDLTSYWSGNHEHVPPGGFIAMAPPLKAGQVTFDDGTPSTLDQQAKDVSAFLMWAAEPKLEERKQTGFAVLIYLSCSRACSTPATARSGRTSRTDRFSNAEYGKARWKHRAFFVWGSPPYALRPG